MAPSTPIPPARPREAASWVLYDVANTVYAATVTFLFATYIKDNFGVTEPLGRTQVISMVLAGLAVPLFASIADRTGRSVRYLGVLTLLCVAGMSLFGAGLPLWALLLAFGFANFTYQGSLVFYNSLLPSVCTPKKMGLVSGLGVGLGYFGTLLTLFALLPLAKATSEEFAFFVAAFAFLALSLPCLILVKERRVEARERFSLALMRERATSVWSTIKGLRHDRPMRNFLIGNFLAVDVLNTAILIFAIYCIQAFEGTTISLFGVVADLRTHIELGTGEVFHPGEGTFLMLMGGALNGLALVFGMLVGKLADSWNSLRTMRMSVIALMLALLGATVFIADAWDTKTLKAARETCRSATSPSDPALAAFAAKHDAELVAVDDEVLNKRRERGIAKFVPASVSDKVGSLAAKPERHQLEVVVFQRESSPSWVPLAFFLSLGVFGSLGLAGIWTAGRKVLIDLAPRERLGEYFGLYGITTKLSVFGGWVFTALLDAHTAPIAMLSQIAVGLLALWFLFRTSQPATGDLRIAPISTSS